MIRGLAGSGLSNKQLERSEAMELDRLRADFWSDLNAQRRAVASQRNIGRRDAEGEFVSRATSDDLQD
jgi:hypothetical protein